MPNKCLPLATRRLYGQIRSADVACPACGTVASLRPGPNHLNLRGYYRCSDCGARWMLGITYWPLGNAPSPKRADDQIPTVEESEQLRYLATVQRGSAGVYTGGAQRHTLRVNRMCTCGECPVHRAEADHGRETDEL